MKSDFHFSNEEIKVLSEAGNLAPSGRNGQPWLVTFFKDKIRIQLDIKMGDNFLDPNFYASFLDCGFFLENVCIAAEKLALRYRIEYFHWQKKSDPIVEIIFSERVDRVKNSDTESLYPYISKRLTNRKLSDGTIINSRVMDKLEKLVLLRKEGFKLLSVSNHIEKVAIARALGRADGIRVLNDTLFSQMIDEFRFTPEESQLKKDGLAIETLEMPKHQAEMFQLLAKSPKLRSLIPPKAFEELAQPLLIESSHLCCITVDKPLSQAVMIDAGRVLEELWLTTTKLELALHPWTILPFLLIRLTEMQAKGLTEEEIKKLQTSDHELRRLFKVQKNESILFFFRLSIAQPPSFRSFRRPWQDYTRLELDATI